ncbi:MAG: RNA polymerase sigma factor [Holophagales bacterium]|nr:RNA polymerase sigma factor [Holophagales bacterium]
MNLALRNPDSPSPSEPAPPGGCPSPDATDSAGIDRRLAELLDEYGPWLRRRIRKICPRDMGIVPEELEQEARVRLWKALESEREIENPASYLHRIAATVTIDAMRAVRKDRERHVRAVSEPERETESPPPDDGLPQDLVSPLPSPEERSRRQEMLRRARELVDGLPAGRRRAVGLYLQGFKIQEIADLVGWSEPKARNLLYRGLATLREAMAASGMTSEEL